MADSSASDADKIRNKRLAKLGQQTQQRQAEDGEQNQKSTSTSSNAPSPPIPPPAVSPPAETPPPAINIRKIPRALSPPSSKEPQPSSTPNGNPVKIQIRPATSASVTPQKRDVSGARTGETIEEFEDRTLRSMFRFSLDPEVKQDAHGHPLRYLRELHQDLESEGKEFRMSTGDLEPAIVDALSNLPLKITPLDHMLGCWKRLSRLNRGFKKPNSEDRKWQIVQEARRLCMSWTAFAILSPELFGRQIPEKHPLAQHLLIDPEDDRGICHDFITEAIARFEEDEASKEIFVGAIEQLSTDLSKKSMDSDYRSYTSALRNLVRYGPIATALTESPRFCDKTIPTAEIEVQTLLGPFFALSPLQAAVTKQYFASPKTMDQGRIVDSQRSLRMTLAAHQTDLHDIVLQLIRSSTAAKEKVLDWFALTVNANHKRRAMRVDKTTVSSDGFMINVTACLDKLCEPFTTTITEFEKLDRIDINYLQRQPRVDMKDETKMNANQEASDVFYEKNVGGANNFITEVFFLTVAAHHYGTEGANSALQDLEKQLKHMQKQVDKFETERHKYVSNPVALSNFERALTKYKDQIDRGLMYKHALTGVLLDETAQTRSMRFMRYVIAFILTLVLPKGQFPGKPISLPLPDEVPEAFKNLPEYFIEDINSNFGFILYNMPQVVQSTQPDEIVNLCITFLRNSKYIKNPYLRSGLVTILFRGTWPYRRGGTGAFSDYYSGSKFANDHLLHALMQFFIEAEFTGGHGQFYDKFNIRYEIFQIIKNVWSNPVYKENLSREAKNDTEFFVRFVNLLLNDVTFVLDESFTAFQKIHQLQTELRDPPNSSTDPEQRAEREEELSQTQGKAKSYMQLANETVAMLNLFTEALATAFTMPEIVQRLADMLDYNLDAMVGPKSSNLKVENLESYNFNPKILLAEFVSVYLNLRAKPNFILAVARDGRSYKPQIFDKASEILVNKRLKSSEEMGRFEKLKRDFAQAKEEDDAAEQDLGEIPEEFLDPLMYTLMEDPVVLPTSRTTIDRSTIRSHLLSDPNDPFNRVPLKIEDVVEDTEMKQKIDAFKAEKRKEHGTARREFTDEKVNISAGGGGTGDGDPMDTAQG
ncbi:MAG: hypothetical protein Q9160_006207 [Pyrenula sp. 1 TL-2023]